MVSHEQQDPPYTGDYDPGHVLTPQEWDAVVAARSEDQARDGASS